MTQPRNPPNVSISVNAPRIFPISRSPKLSTVSSRIKTRCPAVTQPERQQEKIDRRRTDKTYQQDRRQKHNAAADHDHRPRREIVAQPAEQKFTADTRRE